MKVSTTKSEIENRADFSYIRYSQCWEDTEVVIKALDIKPQDTCVSIASAGDNSLALLSQGPKRVIALDLNKSQLALVELKAMAIKHLKRDEALMLLGYQDTNSRLAIYNRLAPYLSTETKKYFDNNQKQLIKGLSRAGKFEKYFKYFRTVVLPLVHHKSTVKELVKKKSLCQREEFYNKKWNTFRWRLMFKVFFSNQVMGLLGRDKEFFKYAKSSLPEFLSESVYNALVVQDPSTNPYLHWILFGDYRTVLPFWLEENNYKKIKANIDKLEIIESSVEKFLNDRLDIVVDCWNLSDIFEYMSNTSYRNLLQQIAKCSNSGARLAYWNMLVPRFIDNSDDLNIQPQIQKSSTLYQTNKTFFYTRFNLEVVGSC